MIANFEMKRAEVHLAGAAVDAAAVAELTWTAAVAVVAGTLNVADVAGREVEAVDHKYCGFVVVVAIVDESWAMD